MSNANINQLNQYDVNSAWPTVTPANADDCLKIFIELQSSNQIIECHGAPQNWRCICSSLDIHFDEKIPTEKRKEEEDRLLKSFVEDADPHFPPGARQHIDIARLKWGTIRNTGTVFVGRHYGLPTRCVDWTSDFPIALFFACRRDFEKDGVVWWMDYRNFSDAIESQWWSLYGKKGNIEDDFEQDFISGTERDILIRLHYPNWMDRPKRQKAHITMSGQYNVNHDEAIHRLGVQNCGRFIITSSIKRELLNRLNRLGINGLSLGVGDSCVETIASDVADQNSDGD